MVFRDCRRLAEIPFAVLENRQGDRAGNVRGCISSPGGDRDRLAPVRRYPAPRPRPSEGRRADASMKHPRVLLADDHRLLREAFVKLLEADCEVVGTVTRPRRYVGSIAITGSRCLGSDLKPTPSPRTTATTASLNGVFTPSLRPCSHTAPLR